MTMTVLEKGIIPITKSNISGADLLKVLGMKKNSNVVNRTIKASGFSSISEERTYKTGTKVVFNYVKQSPDSFELTNKIVYPTKSKLKFLTSYIDNKFRRTSVINKESGISLSFEKKNGKIVAKDDYI